MYVIVVNPAWKVQRKFCNVFVRSHVPIYGWMSGQFRSTRHQTLSWSPCLPPACSGRLDTCWSCTLGSSYATWILQQMIIVILPCIRFVRKCRDIIVLRDVFSFAALLASLCSLHIIISLFSHLGCVRIDRVFTFHKAIVIILFSAIVSARATSVTSQWQFHITRNRAVIVPPSRLPIISARIEKKMLFSRVTSQHRDDYRAIAVYAIIAAMIMIFFVRVSLRNNERSPRSPMREKSARWRINNEMWTAEIHRNTVAFRWSVSTLKDTRMAEPTPEDFVKRKASTWASEQVQSHG